MVQRRIPLTIYRPARAGVRSFAMLAAFEAAARAVIISVFPVMLYEAVGDARIVSEIYFGAGLVSLVVALFTPMMARAVPRRWLYTSGAVLMLGGNLMVLIGGAPMAAPALLANTVALVVMTVCFNAYVMDYIERTSLGRNESARLVYSGAAWAIGPFLGVWLMERWPLAPFAVSMLACLCMLALFWFLRLGDGKVITRSRRPTANPLAYLPRFLAQPLLLAGWLFSCIRSVGWQVYIIYLPIFAVEAGLDSKLGGLTLSISNAFLFLAPLMLRHAVGRSVRFAITLGFGASAVLFLAAVLFSGLPMVAVALMVAATIFLVLLDVCGGLPFLMSVKPSERTEMSAVYSTFRDVSAVVTPGAARLILAVAPLITVFAAASLALAACGLVASRLHPRLGRKRATSPESPSG